MHSYFQQPISNNISAFVASVSCQLVWTWVLECFTEACVDAAALGSWQRSSININKFLYLQYIWLIPIHIQQQGCGFVKETAYLLKTDHGEQIIKCTNPTSIGAVDSKVEPYKSPEVYFFCNLMLSPQMLSENHSFKTNQCNTVGEQSPNTEEPGDCSRIVFILQAHGKPHFHA